MYVFHAIRFLKIGSMRVPQSEKSLCAGLLLVQLLLTLEFHLQSPEQDLNWEGQCAEITSCTSHFTQQNQGETCGATGQCPIEKGQLWRLFAGKQL